MMENADFNRELNMAGTSNQINKMTEDPKDALSPEARVRAAEVATVPSGPSVVVKSASQSVPDMVVDCLPEWTVLELKQFLSDEHSLKPPVKEQRLIYSGHLMKDDSLLTSSLKHSSSAEGRFVLHLVCAPSRTTKPDSLPSFVTHASSSAATNTSSSSSNPIASSLASGSTSGLRHRASAAQPPSEGWAQSGLGGMELPTADVRAQAEAYKQYYESYVRSYMAYLQSVGVTVNPSDPSLLAAWRQQLLALPEQLPAAAVSAPASHAAGVTDQQQPREAQPVQQPQINADELQIVDEDAVPHDWLDSLYIFVRFGILVCFVYFYSSFYRFFIIITVGVLLYLYRVGWFRTIALPVEEVRPREAVQQQEPPLQREPPPTPTQPGASAEQTNTGAEGPSPDADTATTSSDGVAASASGVDSPVDSPSVVATAGPADAASSLTNSTTSERETGSTEGPSTASHPDEGESVRAESETQGGPNGDAPLEPSPLAASDILADSTAGNGTTPPPPAVSLLTLSWTFITALLTSLVPEQQQIL